ncbi:MAG: hypothetical protein ABR511_13605 [Acidimicrobiales bacterium]
MKGDSFDHDDPVLARLDGLDGPVLATFTPDSGSFRGPMVVPTGLTLGGHVLVFMQYDATGAVEEIPTRARLAVSSSAGGTPLAATPPAADAGAGARPTTLALSRPHPLGIAVLVLLALGAAAVAVAVAATVVAVRRPAGSMAPVAG